ncbi:MAG: hypothetical protein GF334_03485, partial [Candidatus Altiarchaeales archaeon]|nr:hypothetical protein [Candidatus Altiarchaeales archaeon]
MRPKSLLTILILATFAAAQTHQVDVYFFYSLSCPHCAHEKPFLKNLENQYEWLKVHYLEVSENPENAQLFTKMAVECGQNPQGVPTTIVCGQMKTGYADDETTGQEIKDMIMHCYLTHTNHSNCEDHNQNETQIQIPVLGEIDAKNMSLPLFTLILGGLDGFNPCAFFVLFFLLSLLIHAKSRKRMLLIGSIFVFFSALIYFLFMSAWLNLFLYIGEIKAITTIAGGIALVIAAINIKDYFWFKKGVSLSIPDSAKPGLYKRMRSLVKATHLPSMIFGTIILAIAANTYELLCTAGFPMIYT